METRANYLMIGGFILGALAFIFIFVFWITNIAGGGNRYQIVFDSIELAEYHQLPPV